MYVNAFVRRHPWTLLFVLLPLFAAVPFVGPRLDIALYGDEAGYLRLADNLVHGTFLTGRDDAVAGGDQYPNLWFGPGLPIVLVPFVAVDLPVSLTRMVGPLCLFLATLAFYALLRLYVTPRVALVGAAAFGLYLPFYTTLEYLHSEPLAILLVVVAMYATSRYLREGALRFLIAGGAALGSLALTRVAFGVVLSALLVLALFWCAVRRSSSAIRCFGLCCIALAICVPWLAYTYSVTERPLYWGSSGGLSFYWMTSPYPGEYGDWHQAREVFADPRLSRHRPFFESLVGLPLVEQNDEFIRQGLENVRHNPDAYAKNVVANVSRMLFDFPQSFREDRLTPLFYALVNGAALGALVLTVVLMFNRWRALPVEALAFGAFGVVTIGLHVLLAAFPRMLFPAIPVIAWFCVVVLSGWIRILPPSPRDVRPAGG